MLKNARVCANVPTNDLQRARRFYSETLGLHEADLDLGPGEGVIYRAGQGTLLHLYERPGLPAEHTVATFLVEDVEAAVADLGSRGVSFEDYDTPELTTEGGVFRDASGFEAAWLKDPDGNILSLEYLP